MSATARVLSPAPPADALTRSVLAALSRDYPGGFAARLWTGETTVLGPGPPAFTLVLNHPGALRAMFWPADRLGVGESYVFGDCDVEGDMVAFAAWLGHVFERAHRRRADENVRIAWDLAGLPGHKNPRDPARALDPTTGRHQPAREREAAEYSYSLPGEYYGLFLDPHMQYTCAYFDTPDQTLDAAQRAKMDHVCRKLRLKPGDRLLDVGCGWGGLLIHAAKHYGVEAVGITLSAEQAAWAGRAVAVAGLGDRVKVVLSDYRDFRDAAGFDKVVSVGMGEAVRPENLIAYMAGVHDCLRPGGAFLYHVATLRANTPYPIWTAFADRYVFPNGRLHTLSDAIRTAAAAGFEVRDVENLREHYGLTLRHWVRRLEAHKDEAIRLTDEVTYRIYRLYLAGATMGFDGGVYELMQTLFVKPDRGRAGLPLTRRDWYA
jgi:cyclopropane-fatty-acyl-phospholipid synthase